MTHTLIPSNRNSAPDPETVVAEIRLWTRILLSPDLPFHVPQLRPERRQRLRGGQHNSDLDWSAIEDIRRRWRCGHPQAKISRDTGIGAGVVSGVVRNVSWEVPEDEVWWLRPTERYARGETALVLPQ